MDYKWPIQFYGLAIVCHHKPVLRPLNRHDQINFEILKQYSPEITKNWEAKQFTFELLMQ